ncbi:MAG: hypothetical protein V3W20_00280 [Candidatus Neomarinimicrobiota bacterium]
MIIQGIDIEIDLVNGILSFTKDGQDMQLTLKSFHVNLSKAIPVIYTEDFKNDQGEIFKSNARTFDAVKQMSWEYFCDGTTTESRWDDLSKMCLNGIAFDYFGEFVFVEE